MQTPSANEVAAEAAEAARLSEEILERPLVPGRTDERRLQSYLQYQQSLDKSHTSRQVLAWMHTQLQLPVEADSDCDYGNSTPTQQENLQLAQHGQETAAAAATAAATTTPAAAATTRQPAAGGKAWSDCCR